MAMTDTGYECYEQTPSVAELAKALAAAQAEMENAIKDSENPAFKQGAKVSRYADLAAVREASKPIYKHGLSVVQQVLSSSDAIGVRTLLLHSSGEWMASRAFVKPDRTGPQAAGSVITYLRRYMLAAMLGIAQEDDDGNAGSFQPAGQRNGNGHAESPRQQQSAPAPQPVRERPWMKRLQAVVGELKLGESHAASLKGKAKEDYLKEQRIGYLRWCTGRPVTSTLDLTDAEADLVIRRAEQGEMPGE